MFSKGKNPILLLVWLLLTLLFTTESAFAIVKHREQMPYKPFEMFGEKIFTFDDVDVTGNFTRFATENYAAIPGFRYSSQLRLTLDGNVSRNVRLNAQIDDTNITKEDKRITLYITGRQFLATLGDFQTSFDDTAFTLNNKKLKGLELYSWLPNVGETTIIASRSEGQSETEIFTGSGMQAQFLLKYTPIVKSSEKVTLDTRPLRRGTDYDIDYEDGTITLDQSLLPLESRNRFEVEYEWYPEGSSYRRTLLAARTRFFLSPEDYIGVSILSDADDKGNAENVDDPTDAAPPTAQRVAGLDFHLNGPKSTILTGEYALSSFDPNSLNRNSLETIRNGHAGKVRLTRKGEKLDLTLGRIEMDPKFDSIGKERLVLDRELTNVAIAWRPKRMFSLSMEGDTGRSNSQSDPDIPSSTTETVSISHQNISGSISFSPLKEETLIFSGRRRLKENRDQQIHFLEIMQDSLLKGKTGDYNHTLRYNLRDVHQDFSPAAERQERTIQAGISGPIYKQTTLSLDANLISSDAGAQMEREKDVRNLSLNLTANPSTKFFASAAIGSREEELIKDNRVDTTLSGDVRVRYNPMEFLQLQGRFREVHSRQFIVNYHETQELALHIDEYDKTQQISINEPVATATGSLICNYFPSSQTTAIAQYQFKTVTNKETEKRMAVSDTALFEWKLSPRRDLVTILKSMISQNQQNAGNIYETTNKVHELEVRKSLSRKTSLIGNLSLSSVRDSYNALQSQDKFGKQVKVEKGINPSLFVHAGYTDAQLTRFTPDRTTNQSTILAGLRFTPTQSRMTIRTNIEQSRENDLGYVNTKTLLDTLLNFSIDDDTTVESNFKFVQRSKNAFEDGYRSRIGKVTVTKRF